MQYYNKIKLEIASTQFRTVYIYVKVMSLKYLIMSRCRQRHI